MNSSVCAIFKRELKSYFYSTTAFVYMTLFLFSVNIFTFYVGNLIGRGKADLTPFFSFLPYIFLMFMPALAMRLWAEERKTGTIELILTLPVSNRALVWGKFLASWAFASLALMGTIPIWLTISYLGNPDQSVIIFSYVASVLMAGCFLSIGGYVSSCTNNQVIAFILGAVICFIFLMIGFPLITEPFKNIVPDFIMDILIHFSLLIHFENFIKGLLSLSGIGYFISFILFWLFMTELKIASLRTGQ